MKVLRILPLLTVIAACSAQEPLPTSQSAQFAQYPDQLFKSFEVSCDGPGEDFKTLGNGRFECHELLPPETTAFLILNYDGFPQKLPQSVRRMSSAKNTAGYRVDAELYFLVPQKDGSTLKVPLESTMLDEQLTELYRHFGGTPI